MQISRQRRHISGSNKLPIILPTIIICFSSQGRCAINSPHAVSSSFHNYGPVHMGRSYLGYRENISKSLQARSRLVMK